MFFFLQRDAAWTDTQRAAVIVFGFTIFAVLIGIIVQQIIWKLSRQPLKNYRNATLALLKKPRTDYNIQKFLKKYYNFFFLELYEEDFKQNKKPKIVLRNIIMKKTNKQLILLFVNKSFVHLLLLFSWNCFHEKMMRKKKLARYENF